MKVSKQVVRSVALLGALALLVGLAAGGFWGFIPGILKARTGAHEVITTIMLNFIALGLASFLLTGPLRGSPPGASIITTAEIPESGRVPSLNGLLTALGLAAPRSPLYGFLVIAVVVGVVVAVLLKRTRFGFDLRATGLSPSAATASAART